MMSRSSQASGAIRIVRPVDWPSAQHALNGAAADPRRAAMEQRIHGAGTETARPDGARAGGLSKWRLRLVQAYVADHLGDKVTLADMAGAARLSRMHFAALFVRATGMRPHDYLLERRVRTAQQLLQTTQRPIVEIALSVGFHTQAHFTTVFRKVTGRTPAKWRAASRLDLGEGIVRVANGRRAPASAACAS